MAAVASQEPGLETRLDWTNDDRTPSLAAGLRTVVVTSNMAVGDALAGLAQAQCRIVLRALADDRDRHRAVHRARKAIRLLRAILALASEELGPSLLPVDRMLKSLARGLSTLRDAQVAVDVAQSLADGGDGPRWQCLADRLGEQRDALLAELLRRDPAFGRRRACIDKVSKRLADMPWEKVRRKALKRAAKRSERRAFKAERAALHHPSAGHLHRWRRRLRRLRMQWQVLTRLDEAFASGRNSSRLRGMHRRTDALGRQRDLRMLDRRLSRVAVAEHLPILRRQLKEALAGAR